MSVRTFGASLIIGGLGLSWLIIQLRGKPKPDSSEHGEKKIIKVKHQLDQINNNNYYFYNQ